MKEITKLLSNFHSEAWRLETRQHYSEPTEQSLLAAYRSGEPKEPPTRSEWSDFVRSRKFGRRFRRVRLAVEPLSTYMRCELEWLYVPSVAAGEEISVAQIEEPHDEADFWIFDEETLARLEYSGDGSMTAVESTTDRAEVEAAIKIYQDYERKSVPLKDYLMRRRSENG